MTAKPKKKTDGLHEYRVERFADLRFTEAEAKVLADATTFTEASDKMGKKHDAMVPLHPLRVKKMLEEGCTHRQAIRIFAPLVCDEPEENTGN